MRDIEFPFWENIFFALLSFPFNLIFLFVSEVLSHRIDPFFRFPVFVS